MINTTTLQGSYVFISYPRSEVVFVKRLVEDLRAHGFQAWLDKTNIDPGSPDWETAIRDAVRNAHAILLIASPRVTKSLYIKGELNLAKRYHPNHIYPIWMDGTEWSDCVPRYPDPNVYTVSSLCHSSASTPSSKALGREDCSADRPRAAHRRSRWRSLLENGASLWSTTTSRFRYDASTACDGNPFRADATGPVCSGHAGLSNAQ